MKENVSFAFNNLEKFNYQFIRGDALEDDNR